MRIEELPRRKPGPPPGKPGPPGRHGKSTQFIDDNPEGIKELLEQRSWDYDHWLRFTEPHPGLLFGAKPTGKIKPTILATM